MNDMKAPRSRRGFFAAGGAALVAAALAAHAPAALAEGAAGKPRLVLQVSDGDPMKWGLALNNAKNVQADYGGASKVDIEIVAYGPGIAMLKSGSQAGERVADAMKAGIHVAACENTMQNLKLTKADMLPEISYVPSGVVELMKKQQQGWAYVRP